MQTTTAPIKIHQGEINAAVKDLATTFPRCPHGTPGPECSLRAQVLRWWLQLTDYGLCIHVTLGCKHGHTSEASKLLA